MMMNYHNNYLQIHLNLPQHYLIIIFRFFFPNKQLVICFVF